MIWQLSCSWTETEQKLVKHESTDIQNLPARSALRVWRLWFTAAVVLVALLAVGFFLFVDEFDPHEPFDTPVEYVARYDPDWDGPPLIWPPYMVGAIDGRFIDIGPKPNFSKGLTVEADVKGTDVKYKFEKPVAVASRPFSHAKTVGVATFGVRGTSSVEKKEGSRMAGNETEYTATFNPSNELLDAISAKMYPEIVSITESVLGVKVVPIETVAATRAWKESGFMSETADGTATSFAKPYKSDKILSDAAIKIDGFRLVTDAKSIIQEAGVNSLLRCVIDLELDIENGKTKLTPTLKYTLYGETNGLGYFPTIYVEGEIRGKETKVNKKTTEAEILEIVNPAAMATALRAALTDLKEKEKANGEYELIWSKQ